MLVIYEGKSKLKRYLRELHLHVGKHMKETNYSIPQPAVCQTLLITSTRPLLLRQHKKKKKTKVCLQEIQQKEEEIHISA